MNRIAPRWFQLCSGLALALGLSAAVTAQTAASVGSEQLEIGRRIYTQGLLPGGAKLSGTRFGNTRTAGAEAACVNCHRPSGMGQVEGDISIPPISGKFLFATRADKQLVNMDPSVSKSFNQSHDPYTEESFASALVRGVNSQGRVMNLAMPRYKLNTTELQALTVYLKQLSSQWSPGVSSSTIRFATVITPDVDPERRKVMKDMVQLIVRQKNGSTHVAEQARGRRHMTSAAELILGTERKWDLDIWELQGEADTWGAQLADLYQRQPVFALISGASNSTWQPVHDFCEREKVPCWFPTLDVPVTKPSQYAFYFSGGVGLEAQVLARHLKARQPRLKRVLQVYRDEEAGLAASQALRQALAGSSIAVESRKLATQVPTDQALHDVLDNAMPDDVLMFWLRPGDVLALDQLQPVGAERYFSAILAKGEHAPLSAKWRNNSYLIYPYELPEIRANQLTYFHAWRNLRKMDLVDEALQSEIFFAFSFMTDTVAEMLENFYRDYLVERAESMLSKREGSKSEQETRDRLVLGRPGDLQRKHGAMTMHESVRVQVPLESDAKSHGTTIYPHLSLGPGQRYASKGAYIVRFANESGNQLVRESDWIVP
jgi:hypothetical protein